MKRLLHALLATALALVAGCPAPGAMPGAVAPGPKAAGGRVELTLVIPDREPALAARRVQHVWVGTTRSVRLTLERAATEAATAPTVTRSFDVTPVDSGVPGEKIATLALDDLPAGNNQVLELQVWDGPLAGGNPTGARLETLLGVVDVPVDPGARVKALVGWRTTPTAEAIRTLRAHGDVQRLAARPLAKALQSGDAAPGASPAYTIGVDDPVALGASPVYAPGDAHPLESLQPLVDRIVAQLSAVEGQNVHPSLVDGSVLAHLVANHTRNESAHRELASGYAIPPLGHPGLAAGEIRQFLKPYARAGGVKVFDLRGQPVTSNAEVWVEEPASVIDAAADASGGYDFPFLTPGDWWVGAKQELAGKSRSVRFQRSFPAGTGMNPNPLNAAYTRLPTVVLPGIAKSYHHAAAGVAALKSPHQIVFDPYDRLYVADTGNHRIVRIDMAPDGTASGLVVLAGQAGVPTLADQSNLGDLVATDPTSGDPLAATLRFPEGVAVQDDGGGAVTVFVADTGNYRVRKFTVAADGTLGKIDTIVNKLGIRGDGADTNADGYSDGSDSPGSLYRLYRPTNLTIAGNTPTLFVHDTGVHTPPPPGAPSGFARILSVEIATNYTQDFLRGQTTPVALSFDHNGLTSQVFVEGGTPVHYLYFCTGSNSVAINRLPLISGGTPGGLFGLGKVVPPQLEVVKSFDVRLFNVKAIAVDLLENIYVGDRWGASVDNDGTSSFADATLDRGHVSYINKQRPSPLFDEVFSVLGYETLNAFGPRPGVAMPAPGTDVGICFPAGLAIRPNPFNDPAQYYTSPLYVATGDPYPTGASPFAAPDSRIVELRPWD